MRGISLPKILITSIHLNIFSSLPFSKNKLMKEGMVVEQPTTYINGGMEG
jgi:hypothetical protein